MRSQLSGAPALRRLLIDLDALIRDVGGESAASEDGAAKQRTARRIAARWRDHADATVAILPTELEVDGEPVLEASDEAGGTWILPLFMSGARALRAHESLEPHEVIRLATALGDLRPDHLAIESFCAWLWSEGAEGFQIDLVPSVIEDMESACAWSTPRAVATVEATSDNDGHALTRDRAALAALTRGHQRARFTLSLADREALAVAADQPSAWLDAETRALIAHPTLTGNASIARLARRITVLAAGGIDAALLRRLAFLSAQSNESGRAVLKACEAAGLADMLATCRIEMSPDLEPTMRAFIAVAPARLIASAMRGLVREATEQPASLDALIGIVEGVGAASFLDHIDLDSLSNEHGQTLATAVLETETGWSRLPILLSRLPEASTAALIQGVPATLLGPLRPTLESLLASADDAIRDRVADTLIRAADRTSLMILGAAIGRTPGRGWRPATLTRLLEAMSAADLDRTFAVDLARSRSAALALRMAVLGAAEDSATLRAAVSRFRFSELVDPRPLRRRLRALRRHPTTGRPP